MGPYSLLLPLSRLGLFLVYTNADSLKNVAEKAGYMYGDVIIRKRCGVTWIP